MGSSNARSPHGVGLCPIDNPMQGGGTRIVPHGGSGSQEGEAVDWIRAALRTQERFSTLLGTLWMSESTGSRSSARWPCRLGPATRESPHEREP